MKANRTANHRNNNFTETQDFRDYQLSLISAPRYFRLRDVKDGTVNHVLTGFGVVHLEEDPHDEGSWPPQPTPAIHTQCSKKTWVPVLIEVSGGYGLFQMHGQASGLHGEVRCAVRLYVHRAAW